MLSVSLTPLERVWIHLAGKRAPIKFNDKMIGIYRDISELHSFSFLFYFFLTLLPSLLLPREENPSSYIGGDRNERRSGDSTTKLYGCSDNWGLLSGCAIRYEMRLNA